MLTWLLNVFPGAREAALTSQAGPGAVQMSAAQVYNAKIRGHLPGMSQLLSPSKPSEETQQLPGKTESVRQTLSNMVHSAADRLRESRLYKRLPWLL
eukprot:scaffold668435_cov48-Prasinocladus_malaysianus.AAC.1